jgi:hypothetical protein
MMKLTSYRAALVLAGTTLALAAGVLPAQAAASASTGWRTEATVAVKGKSVLLSGVDAVSAKDAWAAGETESKSTAAGLLEHWAGKAWRAVTLPSSISKDWNKYGTDPAIGASSSTNVWAFGGLPGSVPYDGYVRLNGSKWTAGKLPGTSISASGFVIVTATKVISSTDVWVVGGKVTGGTSSGSSLVFSPYAAQFNGKKWRTFSVPGTGAITAISEVSAGNIWAVLGVPWLFSTDAAAAPPAVVRWSGSSWATVQPALTVLPANSNLTSVLASSSGTVWIGGGATNSKKGTSEFTAELSDSAWTLGSLSAPADKADYFLSGLVPDGSGGIWGLAESTALGKPRLWHLTSGATKWSTVAASFGKSQQGLLQLAQVPRTKSVWGVGAVEVGKAVDGLFALYGATP